MLKNVYIFRHGETTYNIENRIQGKSDESCLTTTGRQQAEKAGEKLKNRQIEIIISSPLRRTRETAQIIAQILLVPVKHDSRFTEVNLGEAEGLYYHELETKYGHLYNQWKLSSKGDIEVRFPGGESKAEVRRRIFNGLNFYAENTPYTNIAVSGHGIMLLQILLAFGIERRDIPNCSVIQLQHIEHYWYFKGFL